MTKRRHPTHKDKYQLLATGNQLGLFLICFFFLGGGVRGIPEKASLASVLGVPSPFLPGILLSNPPESEGKKRPRFWKERCLKRMVPRTQPRELWASTPPLPPRPSGRLKDRHHRAQRHARDGGDGALHHGDAHLGPATPKPSLLVAPRSTARSWDEEKATRGLDRGFL